MKTENKNKSNEKNIKTLLSMQEDFLSNMYSEKENWIADNKRLNNEIAKLNRSISIDNMYIGYLLNTIWWKMTFPFRIIYRKMRNKKNKCTYNYILDLPLSADTNSIKNPVTVIINTYNPGEEFTVQLENILNQKMIDNIEVIIVDRGSEDNTIKYAKDEKLYL